MRMLVNVFSRIADAMLEETTRSVRRDNLTYLNVFKLRRMERALREVAHKRIAGAYLEFGVALGGSAILIAREAQSAGQEFHGFDVFATIPPPMSEKDDAHSRQRFEVIRAGQAKGLNGNTYYGYEDNLLAKVSAAMARYGVPVDGDRVQLHQGLFEETWDTAGGGPIAFAHIDCDWYDPVSFCLNAIADRLAPGGLILLDDYNDYAGARQAVDEFREEHREFTFEPGRNPILRKA